MLDWSASRRTSVIAPVINVHVPVERHFPDALPPSVHAHLTSTTCHWRITLGLEDSICDEPAGRTEAKVIEMWNGLVFGPIGMCGCTWAMRKSCR